MFSLTRFIRSHLSPAERLGEIIVGVIMAMAITGVVLLGHGEPTNRSMLVSILGCNVAWGIVDGVMYVVGTLFERGRRIRLARWVLHAPDEETALVRVAAHFDGALGPYTTADERQQLYLSMLRRVRRHPPGETRLKREDVLGGLAAGLEVVLATMPLVLPYALVPDTQLAMRASHLIGVVMLFGIGSLWGRAVGTSPWRVGVGLALVGAALVAIMVAFGG